MSPTARQDAEKIQIRPMEFKDIPQVIDIDRQSFSLPWPVSAYEYELRENDKSLLWVAEVNEPAQLPSVIGMIVVWLIVDEAHIATIAVHPDHRRLGVARKLLKHALQEILRLGFDTATLEVRAFNLAAQNLYRSFGFEVAGSRLRYYRDNNEDALIMTVKNLDLVHLTGMKPVPNNSTSGEVL